MPVPVPCAPANRPVPPRKRTTNLSVAVGLPGAGKSTLSHAVAGALRAGGEIVTEPTYRITRGRDGRLPLLPAASESALALALGRWLDDRPPLPHDVGRASERSV